MNQGLNVPPSSPTEANMKDTANPPPGKTKTGFKRMILTLLTIVCVAIAAWIVFINLPRPEFPVTQNPGSNPPTDSDPEAPPAEPLLPFDVSVVYSPGYLIELGGLEKMHPFDIRKYEKIHKGLINDEL